MKRRGYTLVELLIAMTLVALLTGIILAFAVTGVKLWQKGAVKVDTNGAALVTLHAFQGYLQGSHIASAYLNPSGVTAGVSFLSGYDEAGRIQYVVSSPTPPPACCGGGCGGGGGGGGGCGGGGGGCCGGGCLSTPPPLNYAQDGFILWQKRQILYFDPTTNTVRLGEIVLPKPTIDPNPYRLNNYTPSPTDRIIASNIIDMKISSNPLDTVCPCAPAAVPTPIVNPVYVQVTAQLPNSTYSTTIASGIVMENGFNAGTDTGEAVCSNPCTCACPPCPGCGCGL